MDYQPVVVKSHARPSSTKHSPESRYWRQFKYPVFVKEYAPVTSVHFSPSKPHRYAVTAATRVQIYAPRTQKVTKTIARFKDVARSGAIRTDGKLVVAGDDTGLIQVFDINSRAILRTLDSHKQPVYVTKFSTLTPTQILSCSDDTTAKLWDVPSQTSISTFTSHTDYVRTGQVSSSNPNIILTGSYDGTVRMFDARSGHCEMIMSRSNSGEKSPVEQVLMFPSGTVAISSSGPIIRSWDIVAGGRCTRALSNHQKTITSLTFNASASRLLTGGLDQMVKVYDVSTYKVVHTMRYPAPILCLAVSPDESHIAAGMSDGTLSVRRRQQKASETLDSAPFSASNVQSGAFESFLGMSSSGIGQGQTKNKFKSRPIGDTNEFRIESRRTQHLKDYDRFLKSFKYSSALDSVLCKNVPPATTFALIQELIHRDGLRTALAGRDDVLLEPILRLLVKYVTDPRFGEMACDVASMVIEMYASVIGQSLLIDSLFLQLRKKISMELRFQRELLKTKGALDMVFSLTALDSR
ncbi:Trp-Asp repeat-containing protein [Guyanagaster necrorhizus]|uniref:Trp-Asp repeat-containing protein n=1 Tax=Guyanagaster necrorhizus TaxID=856835 RepID=A0A9P7W0K6_9AGAR|nr:Trp-Asp repeat-containing protein [Guyanagaster necrorhizus MCA 3950]KAG7449156.1 Trp-Asp repeat-containing protein [Guyanagaster necrorhizus MCA 3950]